MAHDVFICHSSKDKKIADAICAKLEQNKIRCWIAPRDVVPGSDFAESIVQAIHATKVTVFVFSANSNVSPHVKHELERTVSLGLPVLPFRVDDVVPSPALEYFISSAHWLDALTPPLEQHIDRLVTTVEALLEREVVPQEPVTTGPTGAPGSRRWIAVAVGAALVLGAVAVGLVLALGRGQGGDAASPGGTSPTPSATSSATSSPTPSAGTGPFTDGFTGAVGAGWTWQNEDSTTWRVSPKGWLEIDPQSSPPFHNLLLRDAPGATYKIKLRLRLPPTTNGFAGLVLTADDPETRLQFGWGREGLEVDEYRDGNITAGVRLDNKDLHVTADRTSELFLEISGGIYRARYLDPSDGSYWDVNTGALDPAFTHVGLIAYRTGAGGTTPAGFDRIEFY